MTPDLVAELLRQLMKEAITLAAPLLIAAAGLSFVLSLFRRSPACKSNRSHRYRGWEQSP